ncbi:MarR family winged helix-turn-helix transcriptional regulator [Streptomyces sp. B1I3]|uniref:MarR family winged helix-turn-helix transcriptional regulator n=1 Tax=Streptomyces sp. B1I3 TaxID=3042264 RepID=UPI0027830512|nr:MarR family transcriptional regulator [Streptomyces sp. B1I3]MDQ0793017.1 DNA-binding MarR family transcriptional regulator [Streptomyces sp. B1I3]
MTPQDCSMRPWPPEPSGLEAALTHLQCLLVARRARANPEGVNWHQYDVLELLWARGSMRPSELSTALDVSRQTTSKALRVLKDLGLVTQRAAGEDRRELSTSLTSDGVAFLARIARGRQDIGQLAASVLTEGEGVLFAELCEKVAAAMEAQPAR